MSFAPPGGVAARRRADPAVPCRLVHFAFEFAFASITVPAASIAACSPAALQTAAPLEPSRCAGFMAGN